MRALLSRCMRRCRSWMAWQVVEGGLIAAQLAQVAVDLEGELLEVRPGSWS